MFIIILLLLMLGRDGSGYFVRLNPRFIATLGVSSVRVTCVERQAVVAVSVRHVRPRRSFSLTPPPWHVPSSRRGTQASTMISLRADQVFTICVTFSNLNCP